MVPPSRYFKNSLQDGNFGEVVGVNKSVALKALQNSLDYVLQGKNKPFVYTGTAGIAFACYHVLRHMTPVSEILSEGDLVETTLQICRTALRDAQAYPRQRHGWALLGGHAGVLCTTALSLHVALRYEERRGRLYLAAGLREELGGCLRQYTELSRLALQAEEDDFLYGRAGWVFGGLMLNRHVRPDAVPEEALHAVVEKMLQSGRETAECLAAMGAFPTPLMYLCPPGPSPDPYLGAAHGLMGRAQAAAAAEGEWDGGRPAPLYWHWHGKPYLGAAHGMMGILYVLLHFPNLLPPGSEARTEVEGALRYVRTLECDEQGARGPHGHYPTHAGPWRDQDPLVHWCHGATGAVFLLCRAHQVLGGSGGYLEAAQRSGEAVWERGLLRKGPGLCHGVSGSAYALLHLYKATLDEKWLHRAARLAEFMESLSMVGEMLSCSEEFELGSRTPDHPRSLFEGWAAAACLWADLLEPEKAAFPFFEL